MSKMLRGVLGSKNSAQIFDMMRNRETCLFLPPLLRPAPHHPGLVFCTKAQFGVKTRAPRAEPEQLNSLQTRMAENPLNDFRADSLFLIGLVDDHIPDCGAIDEVC